MILELFSAKQTEWKVSRLLGEVSEGMELLLVFVAIVLSLGIMVWLQRWLGDE